MDWLFRKERQVKNDVNSDDIAKKLLVLEKHKELEIRLMALELEAQLLRRRHHEE